MKRRTDEKTIDDILVTTTQYSLRESLQLQAVLAKLVLPVLAKLEGVSLVGLMKGDTEGGKLGGALMQAAEQLEERELWPLVCRILACTQIQVHDREGPKQVELNTGEKIEANIGELGTLYKIIAFVLIHNFRRSFSAASTALPAAGQGPAKASQSPVNG